MASHTRIRIVMTMPTDGMACAGKRIAGADAEGPTGELRIRAERAGNRTAVVESYRTAPFHIGMPSDRLGDGSAELIIQSVGPGYLPGDCLAIVIEVGPGASLIVRGQGATKLYPSPHGVPATATVALTVRERGRLVYLPGELIPFRQSVLEQVTRIDVARGGSLALGEILTPGRIAMGEAFQFTRLHLDVEARYDGRVCLIERARLDPARRSLTSVGRHGEYPITGTIYLIGEHTLPPVPAIPETVTWATATGDGYTLVRLLGPTVQAVAAAMHVLAHQVSWGAQ
jgi:urease accessory protein